MSDFNVRSDSVDVEQIMRQIRARVREKRGSDYTEAELQQLATVKLEKFLDPRGVRSDLVEAFRKHHTVAEAPPNYEFEDTTLYESHRGFIRGMRKLLRPILKLFFNPDKITSALHIQAKVNTEYHRQLRQRDAMDPLFYEVIHNLVLETTRVGIEVQNLKMRVESLSSRMDFDERRARSLESVVEYKPDRQPRQDRDRQDRPERHDRHDRQRQSGSQNQGAQRSYASSVAPAPQAAEAAVAPPADGAVTAENAAPAAASGPAVQGQGPRPDGERRRRRRRRRRRPGQTLADQQQNAGGANGGAAGAGGAASMSAADTGGGDDSGDDTGDFDGPDDGADDQ